MQSELDCLLPGPWHEDDGLVIAGTRVVCVVPAFLGMSGSGAARVLSRVPELLAESRGLARELAALERLTEQLKEDRDDAEAEKKTLQAELKDAAAEIAELRRQLANLTRHE